MPKFFITDSEISGGTVTINGDNAAHIIKTLRMRIGEELTVCDGAGMDYLCEIKYIEPGRVEAAVIRSQRCEAEPKLRLTVYIALPKSDKLELVVQKSVELGADRICIFKSSRCIPDPDRGSINKKLTRLRRISAEAAGQSLRGRIPDVRGILEFDEMLSEAAKHDKALFFYERGGHPLKELLDGDGYSSAAVIIGPEGGFSEEEHSMAQSAGLKTAYLGKRILRCETAAICAVGAVMFHANEY